MNEMENAHLLLTFARDFFRDSLKTTNKTYSKCYGDAPLLKKQKRIENRIQAVWPLFYLRKHEHRSKRIESLLATDQKQRAGNCGEYADIVVWQGVNRETPNIWYAENDLHTFIMLAGELPDSILTNDFCHCTDNSIWVCDPWCNLVCEMPQYPKSAMEKAQSWEMQGKEIRSSRVESIPATHWVCRMLKTQTSFYRITDSTGRKTDLYKKYFTLSEAAK